MLTSTGLRVDGVGYKGRPMRVTWGVREDGWTRQRIESYDSPSDGTHDLPDIEDEATRGCVLGLIQKAYNDPWLHLVPCYRKRSPIGWELGWAVSRKDNSNGGLFLWGATAGEALLNALEAAPCSHP